MSFCFAFRQKKRNKNKWGHPKIQHIVSPNKKPMINFTSDDKTALNPIVSPTILKSNSYASSEVKRTFLSINLIGSITVEAAIALPLFVFAIISIMYLINILFIQSTMQIQLENVAKLINSSTCITTGLDVNLNDDENSLLEKIIIDSAGSIAVKAMFLTDEIKDFADNTLIVDGSDGLSFFGSKVTNTDEPLDIVLSYKVRAPFIPEDVFTFEIKHHCYFKPFNGKELYKNIFLDITLVYVTHDGDVYHMNKMCTHLQRYTKLRSLDILKQEVPNILPCTFCSHQTNLISRPSMNGIEYVYVTVEKDVYHYVEACPSLQRNLIRLTIDEALGTYTPCNRCVVYTN